MQPWLRGYLRAAPSRDDARNVAIVAHVGPGKTTLLDLVLRHGERRDALRAACMPLA